MVLTTVYNCAQIKLTVPRDGCSLWEMPFNISTGASHDQEQDSEQDTRLSRGKTDCASSRGPDHWNGGTLMRICKMAVPWWPPL